MLVLNAFSPNMIATFPVQVKLEEISLEEAKAMVAADVESAVGHADTAAVFSDVLGVDVPANRISVSLDKGSVALVGQYRGPRLQEGAMSLPVGATIMWLRVTLS